MTFLPIVSRELRAASRRRGTSWVRSGAALVVMVLGAWLMMILQGEPPKELARVLFCLLTGGAVLFALLSGPRFTADCLSEEKREGTLGLLFLTDLKGYDVVLGKLVASSFSSFYSVLAVLPMMAIPLLLGGGITAGELGRIALVLINALWFSLTAGICVSAMSRSAHKASALCGLLIMLLTAGLPVVAWLIALAGKTRHVPFWCMVPSAGFSYVLSFDTFYRNSRNWFWVSLAVVHGMAWVSLVMASLAAPRAWQERVPGQAGARWRERLTRWTYGSAAVRTDLRHQALEVNPVFWLVARIRSKPPMVWCFLGLLALAWLSGWWKFRRDWLNEAVYVGTAIAVNLALRYWFAGEASLALAESRKSGALELLLSTPLEVGEILRGQWLGLRRQFLGPVLAVLAVEFVLMALTVRMTVPLEDKRFWYALWLAGMAMLVADLAALYWVGMWQGLTAQNSLRAAGTSLARILVLPWVGYGLVLLLVVLSQLRQHAFQSSPGWKFFLGTWFGLGLAVDLGFGAWARWKLQTEFRQAAQRSYGAKSDLWRRWFSTLRPRVSGVDSAARP